VNKSPGHILPLGPLLELLKSGGYELSIQQVLEIQSVLLNTPLIQSSPGDLKFILTPLIAKNEEEQNNIYRIIDDWVAAQTKKTIRSTHPLRLWMSRHLRLIFALKIAGFVLVIVTGALFYFFADTKNPATRKGQTNVAPTIKTDTNSTRSTKPPATAGITPASSTASPAAKAKTITSDPGRYERPVIPQPIENNLPMSLVFGFLGGAILYHLIFYERKRKMELEKRKRAEEAIFVAPEDEVKLTVGRELLKTDPYEQVILEFPSNDYLVQKSSVFAGIKNDLKKPAPVQHPAPDIKKSIHSTIRNAGFRTVKYAAEWKPRKYIIISDNSNPDAHITHLVNYFVEWLKASIAPVVHYTYSLEITLLKDGNNKVQFLEELAQRTKDHDLIIVGHAHSFFTEDRRPREKVIDVFSRWSSRSLITPVPLADWSEIEETLKKRDFHIVPAEADAIAILSRTIAGDEYMHDELLAKTIRDSYPLSGYNFQSVQGLKEYLHNEALYQLVCSLAVYPFLNWRITLALFDAVIKSDAEKYADITVSYELLLKVARIPWLYRQQLPDDIRLQLLEDIDPATEIVARETILRLLDEVKENTPKGTVAFRELREQYNLNAFLLYSYNRETYKDYSASREVITHYWNNLNEKALKDHINNQANNLLPVNSEGKHKTVEEFVMEEEEFDKYNVSLVKLSLLILPAFIIYIAFNIIKPAFVYPPGKYRNVSVSAIIEKTDTCAQKLTHATITTNGMSSRHALKKGGRYDTIMIPDIAYTDLGEYYDLALWTGDNRMLSFSVLAKDSFFIVPVKCSE
jgi:hypothetical protein